MLVRLNLLLLMVVSFIPFPTRLLAEYGGDDDADRVADHRSTALTVLAGGPADLGRSGATRSAAG